MSGPVGRAEESPRRRQGAGGQVRLRPAPSAGPGGVPRCAPPRHSPYVPIPQDTDKRLVDLTAMNPSVMGAGGEMISTTSDLNRFMAALLDGRLLPGHLLDEMKTPGVENSAYGLGLRRQETSCGVRVYGNDGMPWRISPGRSPRRTGAARSR
ncbi:serine hydrolase [Streptomyces lancefieldiae]|uniref:Serine hydrolase n=1 Tax=Streptomyces lancefieldiae TaxID=3075520 RepID=A0ABU3B1B7_9ACTN|nr:serine hydrolase [Streptomyces sp. DSM 40712]MDT0615915.1 serine hydrolase [Streptomyces sp. DSM 40712]